MAGKVRKELTGFRSNVFSKWIRDNLPSSHDGFMVSDIDFMFLKKNGEWMLLEEKTRGGEMKPFQRRMYKTLGKRLRLASNVENDPFGGIHLITFHGKDAVCPDTSDYITIENLETEECFTFSNKEECIDFLSMRF